VERPDFKSGEDRQPALGGFDPHSLPPTPLDNLAILTSDNRDYRS
jgi:hypothetical protein